MARLAQIASVLCLLAAPLHAQDAIPQTPPELRDFRIEPERTQSEPEVGPEIRPSLTPPAISPVVPEKSSEISADRTDPTTNVTPERRPGGTVGQKRTTPSRTATAPILLPPIDNAETDSPQIAPEPEISTPPPQQNDSIASSPLEGKGWSSFALGFFALLGILIAGWLIRRRKRSNYGKTKESLPILEASGQETYSAPHAAAVPKNPPKEIRPHVTLEFKPERATLSFSALTVKGTLVIENIGQDAAKDMHMRATMISANRDQAATIDAFFKRTIPVEDNILGDAKAGEKIALELEISIPSPELQSYSVAERQIVVPVIVAELSYRWQSGRDSARLACLVGREAQPPTRKMGPLRLDLGPRSFSPLGQRALHA